MNPIGFLTNTPPAGPCRGPAEGDRSKSKSLWLSRAKDRLLRKPTNWSAHFAWGIASFFLLNLRVPGGWALAGSIASGFVWEGLYYVVTTVRSIQTDFNRDNSITVMQVNDRMEKSKGSLADVIFWILGAVGAAAAWLWL